MEPARTQHPCLGYWLQFEQVTHTGISDMMVFMQINKARMYSLNVKNIPHMRTNTVEAFQIPTNTVSY